MQHSYFALLGKGVPLCPLSLPKPNSPSTGGLLARIDAPGLLGPTSKVPRHIAPSPNTRRRSTTPAAVSSGQPDNADTKPVAELLLPPSREGDAWTAKLVSGATAVFLVLLVPQIIMNAENMMHGNYAALTAIAWVVRPFESRLTADKGSLNNVFGGGPFTSS